MFKCTRLLKLDRCCSGRIELLPNQSGGLVLPHCGNVFPTLRCSSRGNAYDVKNKGDRVSPKVSMKFPACASPLQRVEASFHSIPLFFNNSPQLRAVNPRFILRCDRSGQKDRLSLVVCAGWTNYFGRWKMHSPLARQARTANFVEQGAIADLQRAGRPLAIPPVRLQDA